MTTTPRLVKPFTQVNTTDGGVPQFDGQIAALQDGGYVVFWTDRSHTYSAAATPLSGRDMMLRAIRWAARSPSSPRSLRPPVLACDHGLTQREHRSRVRL
jgi:hypothetical protein